MSTKASHRLRATNNFVSLETALEYCQATDINFNQIDLGHMIYKGVIVIGPPRHSYVIKDGRYFLKG